MIRLSLNQRLGGRIRIQFGKSPQLLLDNKRSVVRHVITDSRIRWIRGVVIALGAVEFVTQCSQFGDVESGHHVVVFVDEIVAVEHVQSVIRTVDCAHGDSFAWFEEDDIFQSSRLVRQYTSRSARTGEDLHVDEMEVHGVHAGPASIVELPVFDSALRHLC